MKYELIDPRAPIAAKDQYFSAVGMGWLPVKKSWVGSIYHDVPIRRLKRKQGLVRRPPRWCRFSGCVEGCRKCLGVCVADTRSLG